MMSRRAAMGALALAAALAAGCGGLGGPAPSGDGPEARLDRLVAADARVSRIAYRLVVANRDLCPARAKIAGWTLHNADQYSAEMGPFVRARFGLEDGLPGILATADEGPAVRAGLAPGDLLVAVNGASLAEPGGEKTESYDRLAAQSALLDSILQAGPARLTVRRGGVERTTTIEPEEACAYPFQVDATPEMNALADGYRVHVDHGLIAMMPLDEDLAFVLAHEMAHNILGHRAHFDRTGTARAVLGNFGVSPTALAAAETEADRWGVYLTARAGYDISDLSGGLLRFAEVNWRARQAQWGHPSIERRAAAVEATVAEVRDRRARGERLTP